ncbi:MAG: TolC family protein [Steroidobacteraceae bacterium]
MNPLNPGLPRPSRIWLVAVFALWCTDLALAAVPLPPEDALGRSVAAAPETRAARSRLLQARSEARLSALGPYEWTLSGAGVKRDIEGEGRFNEWDTALERPVRLPGKAALDRELGKLMIVRAAAELQVVERTTRLAILDAWFACVGAAERAQLLEQDRSYMQGVYDAVAIRRRGGDLAELDEALASAELATANAGTTAARMQAADAARALATRLDVTSCAVESWDAPPETTVGTASLGVTADDGVAADPAVRVSAAIAELASVGAERTRRDRWPDPTLAATYGRERGGVERLGGLSISVPLGVRRRAAEIAKAEAAAAVAAAEHDTARANSRREWLARSAALRRSHEVWLALAAAEAHQRRAADLTRHAFELGELSLAESLIVRRVALQARVAEREAALAAWHALAIDAAYRATVGGEISAP